jgi:hypothetical protein
LIRRAVAAAAVGAGLFAVGCSAKPPPQDYLSYRGGEEPVRLAVRLSEQVRSCWFAQGEQFLAGHLYVPELNSSARRQRILIVRASEPTGLPRLVVQATEQGNGSEVRLFGPMLGETHGKRIERDVARWVAGDGGC